MKLNINCWIAFAGLVCFIQSTYGDCPDKILYCFDSAEHRLGGIIVEQCWKWSRLSCQPCSADTEAKFITYQKYIHHCLYYYPRSKFIFDTKNALNNKLDQILSEMAYG